MSVNGIGNTGLYRSQGCSSAKENKWQEIWGLSNRSWVFHTLFIDLKYPNDDNKNESSNFTSCI